MITLYGLKNCDTCRKALKWMTSEGIEHTFKDIRADGVAEAQMDRWIDAVGWDTLLNRRGTTWRKLADTDKEGVDAARAKTLMLAQPALIKRPVFETGTAVIVGFKEAEINALRSAG